MSQYNSTDVNGFLIEAGFLEPAGLRTLLIVRKAFTGADQVNWWRMTLPQRDAFIFRYGQAMAPTVAELLATRLDPPRGDHDLTRKITINASGTVLDGTKPDIEWFDEAATP